MKAVLSKIKVGGIVAACLLTCALVFILIYSFIIPSYHYSKATDYYNDSDFENAVILFNKLEDFKDSKTKLKETRYQLAKQHIENEKYVEALEILTNWNDYKDSKELRLTAQLGILKGDIPNHISKYSNSISAGGGTSVLRILNNKKVVGISNHPYGQENVSDWENIIAVSVGDQHSVGLKNDGTVIAIGHNVDGCCDVSSWNSIKAIAACRNHSVGLKNDGTVIATIYTGESDDYVGQCDVSHWKDIVSISAGAFHSVGLKSDGAVVCTNFVGDNVTHRCGGCNVSSWSEIIEISAGFDHIVGLKKDGTVIATGRGGDGQCNVSEWNDIIAISTGTYHTVGLKSDGTVIAVGSNGDGQCNVSDWTDIVAVDAGENYTVGLKSDGTVVIATQDPTNTKTDESTTKQASTHKNNKICVECGESASYTYTNPFSYEIEYYCYTHYNEIINIIGGMEEDVGNGSYSKHTCEECNREGIHKYNSFTGETEYYCSKHYEELKELLNSFGLN